MKLPVRFMPHTVTVRPYLGDSSTGPMFGEPFELRCMARGQRRLVRAADGAESLSTLTLYAEHGKHELIPPGSEVDWSGDTTTVLASINQDDGGMGAPQHTEVVCE